MAALTGWRYEWFRLCEKLKRDDPLTLPESRWLAFTLPRLMRNHDRTA